MGAEHCHVQALALTRSVVGYAATSVRTKKPKVETFHLTIPFINLWEKKHHTSLSDVAFCIYIC